YTVNVRIAGTSEICTIWKVRASEICIETLKIELFQSSRLSKMTKSGDPEQSDLGLHCFLSNQTAFMAYNILKSKNCAQLNCTRKSLQLLCK
ncbi:MAG: hypothetical protein ACH254_21590, partial [Candidatus Thiodiazotropha endolucinida]